MIGDREAAWDALRSTRRTESGQAERERDTLPPGYRTGRPLPCGSVIGLAALVAWALVVGRRR